MGSDRTFQELIAQSKGLLLDFDGPVCDVFAGTSAAQIAHELSAISDIDIQTDDPLDLIREAVRLGGPVEEIHQAITQTEVQAIETATETPGIRQLITQYHGPIAIVSNNAEEAIESWLTNARLREQIDTIVGRSPRKMKPDPAPLVAAAEAIKQPLDRCVFLGDSMTDIEAADRAGCTMVALANRPEKLRAFEQQRTALIIRSILSQRQA